MSPCAWYELVRNYVCLYLRGLRCIWREVKVCRTTLKTGCGKSMGGKEKKSAAGSISKRQ